MTLMRKCPQLALSKYMHACILKSGIATGLVSHIQIIMHTGRVLVKLRWKEIWLMVMSPQDK